MYQSASGLARTGPLCQALNRETPCLVGWMRTEWLDEVIRAGARVRTTANLSMGIEPSPSDLPAAIDNVTEANVRTHHVDALRPLEPRDSDVRLTLPARPENVSVIRHVLGAFAEALQLGETVVEDIRLAVTEACTNVVRHAYDGDDPGPLEIVIRPEGERLDVIVTDRGRGIGPSPDTTGPGLGLPLIAAIVHSLEIQHAPSAGSRLAMSFQCGSSPVGVA
jgi:serine/threonine-protein kinase RsbW